MNSKRKILVTGGAGYIGSILTKKLLDLGFLVVVIDNLWFSDIGIKKYYNIDNFKFIKGDIRDSELLKKTFYGVDSIIHLAAIANDPSGDLNPELTRSINYNTYITLLEESKKAGVRRFINASTFSVYGIQADKDITEDIKLEPLKEYSICKAMSEDIVKGYNSTELITSNIRLATVCGWSPRMRFDLIVNNLTYQALQNRKLEVWGGEQKRPQIDIQDITDCFIKFLTLQEKLIGGEVFNAGGQNVSIREIVETINSILEWNLEINYTPIRNDERSYHVSSKKILDILGLKPKRTIKDSIKDIIDAYKNKLWVNGNNPIYHNVKRMKELNIL